MSPPLHVLPCFTSFQILFLNKVDLFRDKILMSDRHLRLYFAQYTGIISISYYKSVWCPLSPTTPPCYSSSPSPHPPGPDRDVDSAARFIQSEFMERNLNKQKMIYPHFTTATDTSNIKVQYSLVLYRQLAVNHLTLSLFLANRW